MKTITLLFLIIIFNCFCACTYFKGEEAKPTATAIPCDTNRTETYSSDVAPFLISTCGSINVSCHNSSASSMIPLDVYVGVQYYGQTGQLMNCLNWVGSASKMPKNSTKLSACDIAMFQKWVNEGEPNN